MRESTQISIKDFSKYSGVGRSRLRFYDDAGVLHPASRGDNNYRYYEPFQLIKLHFINVMVDMGVKLSVITEMDKSRTPMGLLQLLSEQEAKLLSDLEELRSAISLIHTYRGNILKGLSAQSGDIRLEDHDETRYVLGNSNDLEHSESFYDDYVRFCRSADEYRINPDFPVGGYHEDMKGFAKGPGSPKRLFSLDPLGNKIKPKGQYLVGYHRGYYGRLGDLPEKMRAYADERGLDFDGPVYTVYLLDEISVADREQYLACVSVAVSKKKRFA